MRKIHEIRFKILLEGCWQQTSMKNFTKNSKKYKRILENWLKIHMGVVQNILGAFKAIKLKNKLRMY